MNPKGRSAAEDRRGALFWTRSVMREEPRSGGEKSANRRFHAAAVRHRSIEQKQANGCPVSHRPGDGWCRHRGPCDGSEPAAGTLCSRPTTEKPSCSPSCRSSGMTATQPPRQGFTKMGPWIGRGWNRVREMGVDFVFATYSPHQWASRRPPHPSGAKVRGIPPSWRSGNPRSAERQTPAPSRAALTCSSHSPL